LPEIFILVYKSHKVYQISYLEFLFKKYLVLLYKMENLLLLHSF